MCGIIGIIGKAPVTPLLIDALKRLEYRGYDSAGVATLVNGHIERRRAEGKLVNLEARLGSEPLAGTIGIGHTRWATHGKPSERNAHPIATSRVAIVHNGIIENFQELKDELGLDHFEGRGWRGFHHHGALCIAAYAFLAAERATLSPPAPLAFLRPARLPKGFTPRGASGAA